MAIRLGNFGNQVPGRVRQPSLSPAALGAAEANALEDLGRVGTGIVTDMAGRQTALENEQRVRVEREEEQERRRQQALDEKLAQAREGAALGEAEAALADLHDDIGTRVLSGQLAREAALGEFEVASKKVIEDTGGRLSEFGRQVATPRLQGYAARLGRNVRKTVEKRGRQEMTGEMRKALEQFERLYRTDPAQAEQSAAAAVKELGPFSDLAPDQLERELQGWREQTQYTAGFEAVSAGRNDRAALAKAEKLIGELPSLDPQKRAQLLDRSALYRAALDQKAERAAERAERKRDLQLREAGAEFETFQKLADKGTALDPGYIDRALQKTAGTPYAEGIKALAEQARATGGLAAQPVQAQRAALQQIDEAIAKGGRSPERDKARSQVEAVLRGSEQDLDRDPLRAGLERGVITEIRPLDLSAGLQALPEQIGERVAAAKRVSVWAGRPVSPLTSDEAKLVRRQMDALPPKDRANAVAMLATVVGPEQAQGLAHQIDKEDRGLALSLAAAGSKTDTGRFLSELILKGAQAKKDGTSTKDEKKPAAPPGAWRAHMARYMQGRDGTPMFPDAAFDKQILDASEFVAHGIALEQGGALDFEDMKRAVRLAIGGDIVEHNGRRVPVGMGVDLPAAIRRVTEQDLAKQAPEVLAGGRRMPVGELLQQLPGLPLMPIRRGVYSPMVGGRAVLKADGEPLLIRVHD